MARWFFGLLAAYAAIGLVASLVVHIASFFVTPPGGNALFLALHVGIFPLWLPIVLIANKRTGGAVRARGGQSWSYWKTILEGAPRWMRLMTLGFFVYAIANFIIFFLLTAGGHGGAKQSGDPPPFVWHGFSGHWMAFYSAGLAIATAAYLRGPENLAPKCPNGHVVSAADDFCPRCGQAIAGVRAKPP
jgi:hypothetical protein